ncbi:P-loop containing nucleoside triphosphate hydrolase protein [Umbelopsis sp. AD052]|nr:P-loop containing nucleoside triphosphate hydrolase protein [Umbelopsis sp. AD052]
MLCTTVRSFSTFPKPTLPTPAQILYANKLFKQPASFVKSIAHVDQAPKTIIPEVAFVGRSNVGKSTLINKLLNRKGLVKTSSKPGHTRLINFFSIGDQMHLVDMPGYGYRSREEWGESIMSYITTRDQLKRTFVLIDSTVGIKPADQQLFEYFDKLALSYQVILTKRDRISTKQFLENKEKIEADVFKGAICCYPQLLVSGQQRKGRKGVLQGTTIDEGIQDIRWAIVNAAGIYVPPQATDIEN